MTDPVRWLADAVVTRKRLRPRWLRRDATTPRSTGYRPRKGDGAHKIVVEYAQVVLARVLTQADLEALDDLRADRAEAEYGDFAQRRFDAEHIEAAASLADRIVNAIAGELARTRTP